MENRRYQNNPSQQVVNLPQNLYNPVVLDEPLLTASLALSAQTIRDKGAYLFDRIRVGDHWQVHAGVRRTDYENRSVGATYAVKRNTPAYPLVWEPRHD